MTEYKIHPSGDSALVVTLGNIIDPEINWKIHSLNKKLSYECINGVGDTIPAYSSLLIYYKPLLISYDELCKRLDALITRMRFEKVKTKEIIHVPVLYGGEFGIDIEYVAAYNHISVEELIDLHSKPYYLIHMLGFKPGFVYLGGLNDALITPRLESPRQKVIAGSVGIASNQTGIYPQDSPGGWQLIGHTCIELLDWTKPELTRLSAGQYIKFEPVDYEAYQKIRQEIQEGKYELKVSKEEGGCHGCTYT